jgi:hypothetical protein
MIEGETFLRTGKQIRKICRFVAGTELQEEVEHFVDDFVRSCIFSIDFIDNDDGTQPDFEGFAQHESGLRHRTFGGVDEDETTVRHSEDAFDFPAEIGVTGRVDDIDFHAFVGDGNVFGEDCDAPFPLEIVGVEDLLAGKLSIPKLP